MRRRGGGVGVPERLARFIVSEWPGARCPHEALSWWHEACLDWLAADSTHLPRADAGDDFNRCWLAGGSRRVLPFGAYGGGIDALREYRRYRAQMGACSRYVVGR